MMCPNINHPSFKALVEQHGENLAYYYWTMDSLVEQSTRLKPSVQYAETEKIYNGESIFKDAEKDLETGKYIKDGKIFDSVTGDVIPFMQMRPYTRTDTPGMRFSEKVFKHLKEGSVAIVPEYAADPVNKERLEELVDLRVEKGRAKGELIHLKIHEYLSKDPDTTSRISNLFEEANIHPSELSWLNEDAIRAIIAKTGTDYLSAKPTDKIYTEKVIGSDALGWYGTADMFIDHGDDVYSIFDLKTGGRFNRMFEDSFFKYGRTSVGDVFDNARNRAKLQLMLYAFIVKMENPKAKFRNLDILYVKNQWSIEQHDPYSKVNVPAYLEIIEKVLRNDNKAVYDKLMEENPNFKDAFLPSSYMTYVGADFADNHAKASSADLVKHKMLELQGLILWDQAIVDLGITDNKTVREKREKITALMAEIIKLKQDPNVAMSVSDVNMGWMDRYLGSQSYSTNPYVQLYYKELSKAKQVSRDNYLKITEKHDSLLKKVIEHMGLKPLTRVVGGVDRQKLFAFAYKEDPDNNVRRRLVHDGDSEYKVLHKTQQDYLDFINNSMSGVFEDKYAAMIDPSNKTALANRIVTYRKWQGKDVKVTNLNLFNKMYSVNNTEARAHPFKYYKGFFPKFAPQIDDIANMHGGYFSPSVVKFLWNRYTTNYFENTFDQWANDDEAIPMKYLGDGDKIDNNDNYTFNLELSYKSFMKHSIYKAQMDEVYSMGQAMRIYLDAKAQEIKAAGNDDDYADANRIVNYFEDSINLHILGRKQSDLKISSRGFGRIQNDRYSEFNWAKFLRSLKNFFSGPTMWLKPLSGLPNFVFASLVSIKESVKGTFGIATSNTRFGVGDLMSGFGEAFKLLFWDGASNNAYRNNKTYLLMEKFGYLPDNHDWYTSGNEMLTTRNALFTSRTMMMFHSIPEEAIATSLFVAQMKGMKFTKEDGTETNMWDSYEDKEITLPDGTKHTTIEWTGGKRGVRNVSNISDQPKYEDVEGLTTEEVAAIKFLYEKIHGGYRGDERVAAEYYVMGELFLQLKKYMPAILKNVWASKGLRQTQGNMIEEIDANGVKVLRWKPQIIEGRFKTLAGLILNWMSIKHKEGEGFKGNKLTKLLGLQYDSSQSWKELSEAQREDMKDFAMTFSMWILMLVGYMKLWDRDDDDTLKKLYRRVQDDFAGNAYPLEIIKNIKNAFLPTAVNRGYQLLEGSAELFVSSLLYGAGYDDEALTKDGNFRGSANVKRNIHFISSWYDWNAKVEDSELLKGYFK